MYGLDKPTTGKNAQKNYGIHATGRCEKTLIADYSHGMQKKIGFGCRGIHGPGFYFSMKPFEGVDALALRVEALLGRMTERGVTIF